MKIPKIDFPVWILMVGLLIWLLVQGGIDMIPRDNRERLMKIEKRLDKADSDRIEWWGKIQDDVNGLKKRIEN